MPALPSPAPLTRVRLPVSSLQFGMYVAELDRPWLDTPFLLEGLLLKRDAELATLRRYCEFVYVDIDRSTGTAADAIRRAARKRASGAADTTRRTSLREWLRGRRARQALGESRNVVDEPRPAVDAPAAPGLRLPPGLHLRPYAAPVPIEAALPRANESWSRSAETMRALLDNLRSDAPTDLRDVDQVAGDLVASMIETPDAMMWVARLRNEDQHTYQHCLKVAIYLVALGRHMGFPRQDLVRLGLTGMLADVGKIRLPRALLEKPGMLTQAEHLVVRRHVQLGLDSLSRSMTLHPAVRQGIAQHHERLDGSGYPQGLKGNDISIYGRMTAIADCFAALITDRPYAKAMSPQQALLRMYKWCGSSFHEPLVEQFVQAIGVFPVGSLVELSNGEVAIVLEHNRVRRLEPRVLVLAGPDKVQLDSPFERDLLNGPVDAAGQPIRIAHGLPTGAHGLKPHDYYAEDSASSDESALAAT